MTVGKVISILKAYGKTSDIYVYQLYITSNIPLLYITAIQNKDSYISIVVKEGSLKSPINDSPYTTTILKYELSKENSDLSLNIEYLGRNYNIRDIYDSGNEVNIIF